MLYHNDILREPDSRVRELLLGFHPHDIEAPELSEDQRCHLLGQFDPENWIYTDGYLIEGGSRLGAAVIHIPTSTTIHIDASGHEETHTIMRAELVAIYVALDRLNALGDFSLFTDSLSSLQAIRKRLYLPPGSGGLPPPSGPHRQDCEPYPGKRAFRTDYHIEKGPCPH